MRILVVDDDAVFREELAELLGDDSHEVVTANGVAKAVEALEHEEFDLVFTDLKMPRQSGLELLKEVRQRWPQTLAVMVTGFASVDSAVEAMKLGAFDYIRKPFRAEQVRQAVSLAESESRFRVGSDGAPDPDALVRRWTSTEGREVLRITNRPVKAGPHVTVHPVEMAQPVSVREVLDAFLARDGPIGVLIEDSGRLIKGHRRQDIIDFVQDLRKRVGSRGPLVLTFDPRSTSRRDALDLRAAVVGPETRVVLESLSNPLRRAILRRAAEGPCSFTDAMRAAEIEESPKLSFHLRRLVDDGLLAHDDDRYRLTSRGREALRLTSELDVVASLGPGGSAVIPFEPHAS